MAETKKNNTKKNTNTKKNNNVKKNNKKPVEKVKEVKKVTEQKVVKEAKKEHGFVKEHLTDLILIAVAVIVFPKPTTSPIIKPPCFSRLWAPIWTAFC